MVEAERFLLRREKDPALTPDPDWDPSVVGLLNYPDHFSDRGLALHDGCGVT